MMPEPESTALINKLGDKLLAGVKKRISRLENEELNEEWKIIEHEVDEKKALAAAIREESSESSHEDKTTRNVVTGVGPKTIPLKPVEENKVEEQEFFTGVIDPKDPSSIDSLKARMMEGQRLEFVCLQYMPGFVSSSYLPRVFKINIRGDLTVLSMDKASEQ